MENCLRRLSYSLLSVSFISELVSGLNFFSLADVTQQTNALLTFVKIQSLLFSHPTLNSHITHQCKNPSKNQEQKLNNPNRLKDK